MVDTGQDHRDRNRRKALALAQAVIANPELPNVGGLKHSARCAVVELSLARNDKSMAKRTYDAIIAGDPDLRHSSRMRQYAIWVR